MGAIPSGLRDELLCVLLRALASFGPARMVALGIALGVLAIALLVVARYARLVPGSGSPGPGVLAAALVVVGVYVVGRVIDPLLATTISRPEGIDPAVFARIGFFEWRLLGRPWSWPLLPLEDHPALGLALHAVVWPLLLLAVWRLLRRIARLADVRWDTPERSLPWFYRWVGATTAHGADARFSTWARGVLVLVIPLHALAGWHLASRTLEADLAPAALRCAAASAPADALGQLLGGLGAGLEAAGRVVAPPFWEAPGAWVVAALLFFCLAMHLRLVGRPPATVEKPASDAPPARDLVLPDPLRRFGDAVRSLVPDAELVALERVAPTEGRTSPLAPALGALARELFVALTGSSELWSHQRDVLDHLDRSFRVKAPARRAAPSLDEEVARSPIVRPDSATPHALLLAAEGSGRTTLALLVSLHVHLDRGASVLVVARDRAHARAWIDRLRDALAGSSARWNVQTALAGEDLGEALLAGRTPGIVVGGLEEIEAEVLCDGRTDAFLGRLGLVIADDVDAFTGVAEMHLHVAMRRLWSLLDTLHDAPYPVSLLATAGPSARGMDSWVRHVLAAPLAIFDVDSAPSRERVLVRRRDLVDASGRDLPLARLAEACDAGELPWHMRLAGDGRRGTRRAELELTGLRRHHRLDPAHALVVLVEGSFPDVRREARRLAHAGVRATDPGAVVLVLAPPAEEELVLHEEATDAVHAELVSSLPCAVTLATPELVLQRHFDRALGREQDVESLRRAFGRERVDETLERLAEAGKVRRREVFELDRATDGFVTRSLIQATTDSPMGERIDLACVGEAERRVSVVDAGTAETLASFDAAIAPAQLPPGAIFVHARGRYVVQESPDARTIRVADVAEPLRTALERHVRVELARTPAFLEQSLGGLAVDVCLTYATVEERVVAVRRLAPGAKLLERRAVSPPAVALYGTDVCLVRLAAGVAAEGPDPRAWQRPLVVALRVALVSHLRASEWLVDADAIDVDGQPCLAIWDRTPGGSGFARFVREQGLADLLRLARLSLERLVGPELASTRRLHDPTPDGAALVWDIGAALGVLDRLLEARPDASASSSVDSSGAPPGPRVCFEQGEGSPGDLGRLWITRTGRTDDLVWTRHSFWCDVAVGRAPAGAMSLDVAVERRAIVGAVRRAQDAGASAFVAPVASAESWAAMHRAPLVTSTDDLAPLAATLRELAGDHYVDVVLGLVAAIPTLARPLAAADRAPLAVLSRRRADLDAKHLLAYALLPDDARPAVVVGAPAEGSMIRVEVAGQTRVLDLHGPRPVDVGASRASAARVALARRSGG